MVVAFSPSMWPPSAGHVYWPRLLALPSATSRRGIYRHVVATGLRGSCSRTRPKVVSSTHAATYIGRPLWDVAVWPPSLDRLLQGLIVGLDSFGFRLIVKACRLLVAYLLVCCSWFRDVGEFIVWSGSMTFTFMPGLGCVGGWPCPTGILQLSLPAYRSCPRVVQGSSGRRSHVHAV